MINVLTASQMKEVDLQTVQTCEVSSLELMQNAAQAVADKISEVVGRIENRVILIICGPGNNGGDGAALAEILDLKGAQITVKLTAEIDKTKGDARLNFERLESANGKNLRVIAHNEPLDFDKHYDILVDAMFGTGLSRPLEGTFRDLVNFLNVARKDRNTLLFAIDIPSGLNADQCELIGATVEADFTVTFTTPKIANLAEPASNKNGIVSVAQIGTPRLLVDQIESNVKVAEADDLLAWLHATQFLPGSYKGTRGVCLVVAGSRRYAGAAVLAANSAARSGAGMVYLAIPHSIYSAVSSRLLPEIIIHPCPECDSGTFSRDAFEEIAKLAEVCDAMLIGSGVDPANAETQEFLKMSIKIDGCPMIVDAGGLNAISPIDTRIERRAPTILTPHIGEFKRLAGIETNSFDRLERARQLSIESSAIVLLKGDKSLTAAPDGRVVFNPTGTPAVGKAGSGDNLAGLVTGFLAQATGKAEAYESVIAGIYFAGIAAEIAENEIGGRAMIASDTSKKYAKAFRLFEETTIA